VLVAVAVAVLITAGAGAAVSAAQPPQPPALFHGNVTVDGEPAQSGTTITAFIEGEPRGNITIDRRGQYGGPGPGDEKLEVTCSECEGGETVVFRLSGAGPGQGIAADRTATWQSGEVTNVTLSFRGERRMEQLSPDGRANVSLEGGTAVVGAELDVPGAIGKITVTELISLPADAPQPPSQPFLIVDISAPDPTDEPATVRLTVAENSIPPGVSDQDLQIIHLVDGTCKPLNTTAEARQGGGTTLEARTTSFSLFAVTERTDSGGDGDTGDGDTGDGDTGDGDTGDGDTGDGDTDFGNIGGGGSGVGGIDTATGTPTPPPTVTRSPTATPSPTVTPPVSPTATPPPTPPSTTTPSPTAVPPETATGTPTTSPAASSPEPTETVTSTTVSTATETTGAGSPGFGLVTGVVALVGASLVALRLRS